MKTNKQPQKITVKRTTEATKKNILKVGRRVLYPFLTMKVNDEFSFIYELGDDDAFKKTSSIRSTISIYKANGAFKNKMFKVTRIDDRDAKTSTVVCIRIK